MGALALAGFVLARSRLATLARGWRAWAWQPVAPVLAYLLALAPVLFAGRPTFSSYMLLTDSAFHMFGADFLMRHGQHYAHLDLRNSPGQYINAYYNTSYPSGADTLLGGSALLLRLPLIWAFQPFNAFMLATAAGPAWLLARRIGLDGGWAALAALSATSSALVYGYELLGSIKEITALPMILSLGVLAVMHARWLRAGPTRAIPFALVSAAGVSALGVGFGVWVLAAAAILLVAVIDDLRAGRQSARGALLLVAAGAIVALVCAWPTWIDFAGSLQVAQNIAATGNSGNLTTPLRTIELFGTWLAPSYRVTPTGGALTLTHALIAISLAACLAGAVYVIRSRRYALAGWLTLMLAVWLVSSEYTTTWVDAKTLMLTSPAVVLLAWGGVAALRALPLRLLFRPAALLLALALAGGVLASAAMQYHSTDLAPTARYEELGSLNARFAGRGPVLFTDFDEYALYELRDLEVGGPDFLYPPLALSAIAPGHGGVVDLDRVPPGDLRAYPLIITRRDPAASRPPAAYELIWQGTYYQVWGRRRSARAAIAHLGLSGTSPVECSRVGALAQLAGSHGAQLVAAAPPELVRISVTRAPHPPAWSRGRVGLEMKQPGRLWATFEVPHAGTWNVWLQGEIMRAVQLSVDGRRIGSIGEELAGDSLNPDTMAPLRVRLSAGRHLLFLTRGGFTLAPGDGGAALLDAIFLTPAGAAERVTLRAVPAAQWPSLCGHAYDWIEAVHG